MKIFLDFIINLVLFIFGINLFSNSLSKISKNKVEKIIYKYTKTPFRGIILGSVITSIVQSSTLVTITTVSLVNSLVLTFKNSIGIVMGANLGTCITSWIVSLIGLNDNIFLNLLNPYTYLPLLLVIGLFFKNKNNNLSNALIGFSLFLFSLKNIQLVLLPLKDYQWFNNMLLTLKNPLIGIIVGIITTSIIQSSSATVAILQSLSLTNNITYLNSIPIIMGENIGSCVTTLISSINTSKNAKKVAIVHLIYNILGTVIFLILFYLISFIFKLQFIYNNVTPQDIAIIHTVFNLLSIIVFYPFINLLEYLTNKLVK